MAFGGRVGGWVGGCGVGWVEGGWWGFDGVWRGKGGSTGRGCAGADALGRAGTDARTNDTDGAAGRRPLAGGRGPRPCPRVVAEPPGPRPLTNGRPAGWRATAGD